MAHAAALGMSPEAWADAFGTSDSYREYLCRVTAEKEMGKALAEEAKARAKELLALPPPTKSVHEPRANQNPEVLALAALAKHGPNVSACARELGMKRKTFADRMKSWPEFKLRFEVLKKENRQHSARQVRRAERGQQVVTDVRDDE